MKNYGAPADLIVSGHALADSDYGVAKVSTYFANTIVETRRKVVVTFVSRL